MLNKDISAHCVQPLVAAGYKVIIVGYDMCPEVSLEKLVQNVQIALKDILKYAADQGAKDLSIAGHSAGAHLAMFSLEKKFIESTENSKLIRNIYLISGVFNLSPLRLLSGVNPNNIFDINETTAKSLSPSNFDYSHLKSLNVQIYVYIAENESKTFIQESKDIYDVLHKHTSRVEYKLIEIVDHFDIGENLTDKNFEITKVIIENLSNLSLSELKIGN